MKYLNICDVIWAWSLTTEQREPDASKARCLVQGFTVRWVSHSQRATPPLIFAKTTHLLLLTFSFLYIMTTI